VAQASHDQEIAMICIWMPGCLFHISQNMYTSSSNLLSVVFSLFVVFCEIFGTLPAE